MNSEVEHVRVVVRVRPLNKREIDAGYQKVTQINSECKQISLLKPETDVVKTFIFDHIFLEDCTQTEVYCKTTRPVVEKVLQGYNGTVFAYGQTGTGKTYTMTGIRDADQGGIIPNSFSHIFNYIANEKRELTFAVHVTFLEIYNENVRDLLLGPDKKPKNLEIREHAEFGIFVEDLSGYLVYTPEELVKMLNIGDRNRVVGTTELNIASSRSHTIFTITIESSDTRIEDGKYITKGKLQLVDLAGSERQSKTHAFGVRFKEATKINQSLSVLGNVISALVDEKSHIPYRGSKLTRLLQDSLGGNSKTIMITTVSSSEMDFDETISTLRYAGRAKSIENKIYVNECCPDTVLIRFQREIEDLQKQLVMLDMINDVKGHQGRPEKRKDRIKKNSNKNGENNRSMKIETECHEVEEAIAKTRKEQEDIQNKIQNFSAKLLMGGENMKEQVNQQEFMTKITESQIAETIEKQKKIDVTIKKYETERFNMIEKYPTMQEEVTAKTAQSKKVAGFINNLKSEITDLQREQQREIEGLVDTTRELIRELQLVELFVDTCIPVPYQNTIENNIRWNEDMGEFRLKGIGYTGNNIRKKLNEQPLGEDEPPALPQYNPYRQYAKSSKRSKCESNSLRLASHH